MEVNQRRGVRCARIGLLKRLFGPTRSGSKKAVTKFMRSYLDVDTYLTKTRKSGRCSQGALTKGYQSSPCLFRKSIFKGVIVV